MLIFILGWVCLSLHVREKCSRNGLHCDWSNDVSFEYCHVRWNCVSLFFANVLMSMKLNCFDFSPIVFHLGKRLIEKFYRNLSFRAIFKLTPYGFHQTSKMQTRHVQDVWLSVLKPFTRRRKLTAMLLFLNVEKRIDNRRRKINDWTDCVVWFCLARKCL